MGNRLGLLGVFLVVSVLIVSGGPRDGRADTRPLLDFNALTRGLSVLGIDQPGSFCLWLYPV